MYQYQLQSINRNECISPSRRQLEDYLEINQPVGDTSSVSALNMDNSNSYVSLEHSSPSQRQLGLKLELKQQRSQHQPFDYAP